MKLRNIYLTCVANLEILDGLKIETVGNRYRVSDWEAVCQAVTMLRDNIKYLENEADELIKSVPEVYRYSNQFVVDDQVRRQIQERRKMLRDCMVDAINLYESLGFDSEERVGLDIKLPSCNDFSEFKKYIDELDFILYKCPFMRVKEEDLKFDSLDVGSMWLTFFVVGAGVAVGSIILNNIAAFIDKCLIIRSHKNTLEQQKLQLEELEMEKDAKKVVLEGLEKLYDAEVNKVLAALEKETGIELADGEETGAAIKAFDKANTLMDKGMQFIASADSSKEVKALFEPLEMKYLEISKELKLLEEKKNNDEK